MKRPHAESAKSTAARAAAKPNSALIWARLLVAAALAVGGYLLITSLRGAGMPGCGPNSDCDAVLSSKWSRWFGLPVTLPALGCYAVVLAASFGAAPTRSRPTQLTSWKMLVFGSVAMLGAALWFTILQLAVIKSVCPYCMAAHALAAVAGIVLLATVPRKPRNPKPGAGRPADVWLDSGAIGQAAFAGGLALAVMVAGQLTGPKASYVVAQSENAASQTQSPQKIAPETQLSSPNSPTNRQFSVLGGKFMLNLHDVPLWGSPNAPQVVVSLFDFTCHHCRTMHGHLKEVFTAYSNSLAIVSLPMPLDAQCNSAVSRTARAHLNACNYARFGLAVWHAKPSAMRAYEDWFFKPDHPPALSEAMNQAMALVGTNEMAAAIGAGWVERQLQQSIAIYTTNYFHSRIGSMPQLIIGNEVIAGPVNSPKELEAILTSKLSLPQQPAP